MKAGSYLVNIPIPQTVKNIIIDKYNAEKNGRSSLQ